jgi:hypothetical protein
LVAIDRERTSRDPVARLADFDRNNEFVIRPGDVLIATDTAGTGHEWRLIDDAPWRRCYVVLKPGAADLFVPKR